MLSNGQIIEFQTLYKNRFGKEISKEAAYEQGIKLLRLVELIYKPMTESEYKQLQERQFNKSKVEVKQSPVLKL